MLPRTDLNLPWLPWVMTMFTACFFLSCHDPSKSIDQPGRNTPLAYEIGDTLELDPYPENLKKWMDFYGSHFPGFNNGQFKASGITFQADSMKPALSSVPASIYRPFLAFDPDSTVYIDAWSYDLELKPDSIHGGVSLGAIGPDQEVVIGEVSTGKRWQLMFNGPSMNVQAADWLDHDAFMLALMHQDEKIGSWTAEVYLFNRKDSTFTNFTWTRKIRADSMALIGSGFFDNWFRSRVNK